jgi:hypothetical protein
VARDCWPLRDTHFSWIGAHDDHGPFYYRIYSPVVLIEFDHQPGIVYANDEPTRDHIHTVVRTPNGNDYGKDLLRQHYARHDHSHPGSAHRLSVKPRLSSQRGNAILVASGIYDACKYFMLFQKTPLKGKCAVVTSYNPQAQDAIILTSTFQTVSVRQVEIFRQSVRSVRPMMPKGCLKAHHVEVVGRDLFCHT